MVHQSRYSNGGRQQGEVGVHSSPIGTNMRRAASWKSLGQWKASNDFKVCVNKALLSRDDATSSRALQYDERAVLATLYVSDCALWRMAAFRSSSH